MTSNHHYYHDINKQDRKGNDTEQKHTKNKYDMISSHNNTGKKQMNYYRIKQANSNDEKDKEKKSI